MSFHFGQRQVKNKVKQHIIWLLFIIFPNEPENGTSNATFPAPPVSLSYLHHIRKETYHSHDLTMYYTLSSKTADFSPKKSMKKWLESLSPISLTTWFCRTRLLVCGLKTNRSNPCGGSSPNSDIRACLAHPIFP